MDTSHRTIATTGPFSNDLTPIPTPVRSTANTASSENSTTPEATPERTSHTSSQSVSILTLLCESRSRSPLPRGNTNISSTEVSLAHFNTTRDPQSTGLLLKTYLQRWKEQSVKLYTFFHNIRYVATYKQYLLNLLAKNLQEPLAAPRHQPVRDLRHLLLQEMTGLKTVNHF